MPEASIRVEANLGGTTDVSVRASRLATDLAGGTAVSITAPTGTTTGDIVVVVVHANGQTTTITDNNGGTPFTEDLTDVTQASHTVSVFSRRIQGGDPSSYAFTLGSSQRWTAVAVTLRDVHASVIYDVSPTSAAAATTSVDAPSITTLSANALHCAVGLVDGVTVAFDTTPSGYTVAQSGGDMGTAFTHKTIPTASSTGAQTFTASGANPGMMAVSFAIRSAATPTWSNLTPDTVAVGGIRFRRGMVGGGPMDRVATTGTLEFVLRNDAGNSGGLQGYYSPNHSNVRSGWTFGIPVRVIANYSSTDYSLWRGRIRTIQPTAGRYREQRVYVTAQDAMGDMAEARVRAITPQVNQQEDDLLTAIVNAMPSEAQPPATSFDTGLDTFPYAFNDIGGGASAMSLATDVVMSSLGKLFATNTNTLTYQNRHATASAASSNTLTESDIHHEEGVMVPSTLGNVYNRVRATVHPRTVDAAATTVLYRVQYTTAPSVGPGESATIWGEYQDPSNVVKFIGGTEQVTPVSGTDYVANSQSDGLGTNLTSQVSVTATAYASSVKFVLTNNASVTAYFTTLQIRGKGIYDDTPLTVESFTAQSYGDRPVEIDLKYQDDATVAQGFADYLKTQYLSLANQAETIVINPQRSNTLMLAALQREIGDVVTVSETMTGLSALEVVIQGVEFDIRPGPFMICRWRVAPALTSDVWLLDDAVASVLGSTTVPGYA